MASELRLHIVEGISEEDARRFVNQEERDHDDLTYLTLHFGGIYRDPRTGAVIGYDNGNVPTCILGSEDEGERIERMLYGIEDRLHDFPVIDDALIAEVRAIMETAINPAAWYGAQDNPLHFLTRYLGRQVFTVLW